MSEQRGTALSRSDALIEAPHPIAPEEYRMLAHQAQKAIESHMLPSSVKTPQQALIIMLKGREIGVSPMYALSNIAVINGKPTCGAELMLALIYRHHGDDAVRFKESSRERCTVRYKRRSWTEYDEFTFDMEDARLAGLLTKDTWKSYPAAMLRARCISAIARMAFPDCLAGMYTPEEMGADVEVDQATGDVLLVQQPSPAELTVESVGQTPQATDPAPDTDHQTLYARLTDSLSELDAHTPDDWKTWLQRAMAAQRIKLPRGFNPANPRLELLPPSDWQALVQWLEGQLDQMLQDDEAESEPVAARLPF